MLLSELLDVKEQSLLAESLNLLFEYLGNLDVIDKSLLRPLQNVKTSGYGADAKKSTKLNKPFGQNSGVEKSEVVGRNGDKTWSTFADNKEYLSLVMSYDGDQVMALTDLTRIGQSEPGKANLIMVLNTKFFTKVMDEKEFNDQFGNKSKAWENRAVQLSNSSREAQTFARKIMDIIVKKARAENKTVEVMFITKDTERSMKSAERAKQRQGRVPTPNDPEVITYARGRSRGAYELYIDGLKSQLRDKLEKYKSSKAKKVESPEEFLKLVIEEGYLDKITVKGVTYKFSNERVYMRDLINASKGKSTEWSNESYIQYEMESSDYYELRAEIQKKYKPELEKLDKEAPDFEKKYDELRDKMYSEIPPRTLKVMLKLKGGSIVPVEVKPEYR
jgi:hypothetical protein